jgi:hypothetical protein
VNLPPPKVPPVEFGFIHPTSIEGNTAAATVRFIIRDHDNEKLAAKGRALQLICEALQAELSHQQYPLYD